MQIDLDGDDAIRAVEQMSRKRSPPGTDFHGQFDVFTARRPRDLFENARGSKEMLPEFLAGHSAPDCAVLDEQKDLARNRLPRSPSRFERTIKDQIPDFTHFIG